MSVCINMYFISFSRNVLNSSVFLISFHTERRTLRDWYHDLAVPALQCEFPADASKDRMSGHLENAPWNENRKRPVTSTEQAGEESMERKRVKRKSEGMATQEGREKSMERKHEKEKWSGKPRQES